MYHDLLEASDTVGLNTYVKFQTRRGLDSVRSKYHLYLERGGRSLDGFKSAIDIAVSVPEGVYNIIANFLAWLPRKGDRVDVLDIFPTMEVGGTSIRRITQNKVWRPARVLEVTKPFTDLPAFKIHFDTWGTRYDNILTAVKIDRIQTAFKKTPNWRPKIKKGDYVEFLVPNRFDERYWRVGIILKKESGKVDLMTAEDIDSPHTKRRMEEFMSNHNATLDEFYTGYSNHTLIDRNKVYLYKNIDIHSEIISLYGTHLKGNSPKKEDIINKISRRLGYPKTIE